MNYYNEISNFVKKNMTSSAQKKTNIFYFIFIFLLMILLAILTYKWSTKRTELNNCTNKNLILQSDLEGMNQMLKGYVGNISSDLKKDLKNMLTTYDKLIAKDASKADSLNEQKNEIQLLLDKLEANKKLSASQLYKFKKENETLRGIMRSYVMQIDSLNTLNYGLSKNLEEKTNKLNETSLERDEFKKEVDEKTEQVKKGSKLKAYNILSEALRMKNNNTTVVTTIAKKTVQIKSSFTISENTLTSSGRKSVYLQITNPNGTILYSRGNNTIETESGSVLYSDKKEIDYQNQSIDLSIYYDLQGETIIKGS
jgi:murein DD-endopeptidase MepM/ murein hydrolase activator NlpD